MQIGQEMRWTGNPSLEIKISLSLETALYRGRARSNSLKVIDQGRAKSSYFAKYRAMAHYSWESPHQTPAED